MCVLVVTGTPFSVSAAVGFISIFAIAIKDGILLNFYIHQLWKAGHSVVDSIIMDADRRYRGLVMTALVDGLGFCPLRLQPVSERRRSGHWQSWLSAARFQLHC